MTKFLAAFVILFSFQNSALMAQEKTEEIDNRLFIAVEASDKIERSAVQDLGMSIEAVYSDRVWGFSTPAELAAIRKAGKKVLSVNPASVARGGHDTMFGYPGGDEAFHDYPETVQALRDLESTAPDYVRLISIGRSLEGREMYGLHLNTSATDLASGQSGKPGIVFLGAHHAREHVSKEVPLMLAQYLVAHRGDAALQTLLANRDIWIIPIVNPDGVEYDISNGRYRMWRKNRRPNGDGTFGVDLNRNYPKGWGGSGASASTNSDTYRGRSAFSEPETQAVRDFVSGLPNVTSLLSFHTFSELILYPWSHTFDSVSNSNDLRTFSTMAQQMAAWNRYTAQQASDLYISSGDTTDWAYDSLGIFAFTFELSPRTLGQGGFYPGASIIQRVFNDNLNPCMYMIDLADNPRRVTFQGAGVSRWVR